MIYMMQELNEIQKNVLWKKIIFQFNILENINDDCMKNAYLGSRIHVVSLWEIP